MEIPLWEEVMYNNTTGSNNTAIGFKSLDQNIVEWKTQHWAISP